MVRYSRLDKAVTRAIRCILQTKEPCDGNPNCTTLFQSLAVIIAPLATIARRHHLPLSSLPGVVSSALDPRVHNTHVALGQPANEMAQVG